MVLGAVRHHPIKGGSDFFLHRRRGQIVFVHHRHSGFALAKGHQFFVRRSQGRAAVKHRQHQPRLLQPSLGSFHADLLHHIVRLAQPGGIRQPQGQISQPHRALHHISGGALHSGHNAGILTGQIVHQGAFAHIGAPNNHRVHPGGHQLTIVITSQQVREQALRLLQALQQGVTVQFRDLLVRVVHPGRHTGAHFHENIQRALDLLSQGAGQGGIGTVCRRLAGGGNQIRHAFRLG